MTKVTPEIAGRMQQHFQLTGCSVNQLSIHFGVDWHTAHRCLVGGGVPCGKRKHRKTSREIHQRRKAVKRLALKIRSKDQHEFALYPSTQAICDELHVEGIRASKWSVYRDLLALGFESRVRRRVPIREAKMHKKRMEFAANLLRKPQTFLKQIVFSDEHVCSTNDYSHRLQWVRAQDRILTRERKRLQNVPHIMIWTAIGVGFKGPIVLFPQKNADDNAWRMNAESYIRRCLSKIVPELKRQNRVFQQDGARVHTARRVTSYLEEKGVSLLHGWPAYSPDLNCIEQLWPALNVKIGSERPATLPELERAIQTAWNGFPQKDIDAYAASFRTKLVNCKENFGAC